MSQSSSDPNQRADINNASIEGQIGQAEGDLRQFQGEVIIEAQGDHSLITYSKTQIIQIITQEIKSRALVQTSPYKGLKRFEPEDHSRFFGRIQFLTGLVNDLEQSNLVLLLGASGSGKSSVIRAGLIPLLAEKWGTRFVNLMFTPDEDPFESLYASLLNKYKQSEARVARQAGVETLTHIVKALKQPEDYWLILIDQFEELFTLSQREKCDRFIDSLANLIGARESRIKLLFTMRADFLDRLSAYPSFSKLTQRQIRLMTNMQRNELRLAIEQPAAQHGVLFEDGLVNEIIEDVQGQAGYLPFLQYTLNLLWETEARTSEFSERILHISTYRQLGGVRGALQQHIDQIYDAFSKAEKLATQRILLKLVDIGGDEDSGTEWKPVRRRANRAEFTDASEQQVLMQLIDRNLLVSNRQPQAQDSTIEIAHEALLTSWIRLNQWIQENRRVIALRNRLNEDVARWQAKKRDDELWGGSKLEQVLELRKDSTFTQVLGGFSPIANQFIDASMGRRDRQRRRIITGLTGFSAVTLMMALITFQQYLDASKQKISAELKAMIAKSELLASEGNQFDALITSLEAARRLDRMSLIAADFDTRNIVTASLQQVIGEVKEFNRLERHTYSVTSVNFSPDGHFIASASEDGTVKLWDSKGKFLKTVAMHNDVVNGVSFSRDGTIASASGDGTVKLRTANGLLASFPPQTPARFSSISFSSTGQIVTASNDGKIAIWNQRGVILKNWLGIGSCNDVNCIRSVIFNSKGNLIASAGNDGAITLWNLAGKRQNKWNHKDAVNSISFSPDADEVLIAGTQDGKLILWNQHTQPKIWVAHSDSVNGVSFSPDGKTIASAGSDRKIKLWDREGNSLMTLQGHTDSVNSVSFSPDGQALASASVDNTIKLWHIHSKGINRFDIPDDSTEKTLIISPDGTRLASLSKDSTAIHVRDVKEPKNVKTFSKPNYRMTRVGWSFNGQWIASIGEEDTKDSSGKFRASHITINLWDRKGEIQKSFEFKDKTQWTVWNVNSLRFSPDGKWIAFGCDDGTVNLWDLERNTLQSIHTSKKAVQDLAFSPDGRIIVSASDDFTIKLWSLDGQLLKAFEQKHQDRINRVSFSQDGQTIGSTSDDATIQIWNLKGILLSTLKGHNGKVNSVSFSPDGNLIASAGADKTVRLWSRHGTLLATLRGHDADVVDVYFNTSGMVLISADQNNSAIFWNLNLKDIMQQSCNWLQDYFTNNSNAEQRRKELCPNR